MKLSRLRRLGRYVNPATGRPVNIHKGTRSGGWPVLFYLVSGRRVIVPECDFWGKWQKAADPVPGVDTSAAPPTL